MQLLVGMGFSGLADCGADGGRVLASKLNVTVKLTASQALAAMGPVQCTQEQKLGVSGGPANSQPVPVPVPVSAWPLGSQMHARKIAGRYQTWCHASSDEGVGYLVRVMVSKPRPVNKLVSISSDLVSA
jgi:hypothetical protein